MAKRPRGLDVAGDGSLVLPLDIVTQANGIVAVRRAGKSNAAAVMAEGMYDAGLPWVAIDPKGDWWGLRSSADGKGPGLPVPIFGGLHGDLPLLPESGRLIAELIVGRNLTCILDVSRFSKAARARFLTAFGDRLFELHQADPQPRHLFLEEAERVVPQVVRADMAACVGVWSDIVRLGGAFGLGVTLISQRFAVVSKDVATQIEVLFLMRTTSPQDRKAAKDWLEHHAIAAAIVDSLPGLASGEAWVSSAFFLAGAGQEAIQRIRFRRRRTFDSGATPAVGQQRRVVATLADIDLAGLETQMAAVVEKAAADDPKALRRRIADLERAARQGGGDLMAQLQAQVAELRAELAAERARPPREVAVLTPGDLAAVDQAVTPLRDALASLELSLARAGQASTPPAGPRLARGGPLTPPPRPAAPPAEPPTGGEVRLKAGARKMLAMIARMHPVRVTPVQLGTLAGFAASGGTFGEYLRTLRRAGLVTDSGPHVVLTDEGFAATAGTADLPLTADDLREIWHGKLKAGARAMLDALITEYPDAMTREKLAAVTGFEVRGGTFGEYVRTLRRNDLITEDSDGLRAADVFFLAGSPS